MNTPNIDRAKDIVATMSNIGSQHATETGKLLMNVVIEHDLLVTELRARIAELEAKVANQAGRIRYLEGATNHATGTPLSHALNHIDCLEALLRRALPLVSDYGSGDPELRDEIRQAIDAARNSPP